MSAAEYSIEVEEKYTTITVNEDKFTAKIAPTLKTELIEIKAGATKNIIFDLSNTTYCDSSGLSVILIAQRITNEKNGCLVVCGLSNSISKLIEISQLTSVLNITPTKAEAVDFIYMDELEKDLNSSDEI